jgi:hypothetical protein
LGGLEPFLERKKRMSTAEKDETEKSRTRGGLRMTALLVKGLERLYGGLAQQLGKEGHGVGCLGVARCKEHTTPGAFSSPCEKWTNKGAISTERLLHSHQDADGLTEDHSMRTVAIK